MQLEILDERPEYKMVRFPVSTDGIKNEKPEGNKTENEAEIFVSSYKRSATARKRDCSEIGNEVAVSFPSFCLLFCQISRDELILSAHFFEPARFFCFFRQL